LQRGSEYIIMVRVNGLSEAGVRLRGRTEISQMHAAEERRWKV